MDTDKILRKINRRPNYRRVITICMIIISFLAGRLSAQSRAVINSYADKVSAFYNIPREILPAIIQVESSYQVDAASHKGAHGLMQITDRAYQDYLKYNPSTYITNYQIVIDNWQANIAVGAWYLKNVCYRYTGDWRSAISSFFWGVWNSKKSLVYYEKVRRAIDG